MPDLVSLSQLRQQKGSANDAHGNDVSAHFKHALLLLFDCLGFEETDDESSRSARMSAGR
jgi:hypothetical protein